ncbi:MAG: acylneuraminate cytidylyltransferase family protein [Desulfobacteraceae bacterium]|nr:MAG: acylneuraminate cytidylyltransferase family protein [Desulfobacteraceae bacterium]
MNPSDRFGIAGSRNCAGRHKPEVLAIIPARGGSKGIPRKNVAEVCGKPLVAYSIEAALKTRAIDRVVVSTDDEEIAHVSRSFGAEVPFLRPKQMATDRSTIGEAIDFTAKKLREGGYKAHVLVTLYPTHPFRTPALLNLLVQRLLEGFSPVTTVKSLFHTDLTIFDRNNNGCIIPLLRKRYGSQTAQKVFYRQYGLFLGEIYGSPADLPYVHVIDDPVSLIDIDTPSDLRLAEEVIKRRLFDFDRGSINACHHTHLH